MFEPFDVLVTTQRGMERVAASRIAELDPQARVEPKPLGLLGLVLVRGASDRWRLRDAIKARVPEAEKVLAMDVCVRAELDAIAAAAGELAARSISKDETFAVRTNRRGSHDFTSVDVNVRVGDVVRRVVGAEVDLSFPDKILWVEIVGGTAGLTVTEGREELKKDRPDKVPALAFLRKMSVVQMPYLGPKGAAREFGVRIGRCVQTFEVMELVIAPAGIVSASELSAFIRGVMEGIRSRYEIQKRIYAREVREVPVYLQDLYQLVRDRHGEPMIVLEPEGEQISKVGDEVCELFGRGRRVNLLLGSREGIPTGIYRFADLVIDLCPGVTISTDFAASSAIMALLTVLEERASQASSPTLSKPVP
ncbi:MAG: SPOUT family RNA methylase [Candidatus Alkanophagales archaeon]